MKLTNDQRLLLAELESWQLLALADAPAYWCKHIRDSQGGGTARNPEWRAAGVWRNTYSWGLAITTLGDYTRQRRRDDPAHAVTLTWSEITRWVEALPAELRADVRRSRKSDTPATFAFAELILTAGVPEPEPTLW